MKTLQQASFTQQLGSRHHARRPAVAPAPPGPAPAGAGSPARRPRTGSRGILGCILALALIIPAAVHAQGTLANGGAEAGAIAVAGATNYWTFAAASGEYVIVRMGKRDATASLVPYLRLFGPNGALLDSSYGAVAAEVQTRVTASGTFTVVASDASSGARGTGPYRLTLAKTGSPIVVSDGDEGGTMTNGTTHAGAIVTGDLDVWSVAANAGEYLIVRMGDVGGTNSLTPYLRLLGPDGVLLDSSYGAVAAEVKTRATLSGTFTVVVGDASSGSSGTGPYQLTLAKTGGPIVITDGDEGGLLTNGTTHAGTIVTGDLDVWSVAASAGEYLIVRMGDVGGTNSLTPYLRLLGPDGVLLDSSYGAVAAEVKARATLSGAFTVVVGDASSGLSGIGPYQLTLAKTGGQIVVTDGDEGGPMTNGTTHSGTIIPGDLDVWSVAANAGDSLLVRMGDVGGTNSLTPYLRLLGPDGVLLDSNYGAVAAEVQTRATLTGTFTVVAGDASSGSSGIGPYQLTLVKTGSPIMISNGDEGGWLTNGVAHSGVILSGDLDAWAFTACAGAKIQVQIDETTGGGAFVPWIRLYGRDGALLRSAYGQLTTQISLSAPADGTYTIVVGDASSGYAGSGTYRLTATGIYSGLMLCTPSRSGARWVFTGAGGNPGGPYVVLTTTNVTATPWTPILTNQFGEFGEFTFPSSLGASPREQFFRLRIIP